MQRLTLMRVVHGVARIAAGCLALSILLVFGVVLLMALSDDPGSITSTSIRLHYLDYIKSVGFFFWVLGVGALSSPALLLPPCRNTCCRSVGKYPIAQVFLLFTDLPS